ncbi:MAG: ABC transporter ATP-binding protein [Alphaproteobacteria bacterium]|nr:ABC transporter ATP-binding protein [Alphaproteobacteria bacterium]
MALLEVEDLVAGHGKIEAVRGLSLRVEEGEIVALLGANGAGKSTTLRAVSGLLKARSGMIRFAGTPISGEAPERIARRGIAHVPEGRRIFPGLTLRENILIGAANRGGAGRRALATEVERMLALFPELRPSLDARGWTLSGGQQQMAAIARGLMAHPRLLLLDEPSLGLSPIIVRRVFDVVAQIAGHGTAVLLVEQNARAALAIAGRGYVLEAGRLAIAGPATELWNDDAVRAAYLGDEPRRQVDEGGVEHSG